MKPTRHTNGKPKDEISFPIENSIITTELYEGIVKSNSLSKNEILSVLFTIANCVFLTKTYPEKYPKFNSYLKSFKMDVFNTKELKIIKMNYRKIINSLK